MRAWWLGGLVVVAAGCDPEAQDACAQASKLSARLELGNGIEDFGRPIADGDLVQVAYGMQGGQHVWMSVRTVGLVPGRHRTLGNDQDVPVFEVRLLDEDGGTVETQTFDFFAMAGTVEEATLALGTFFVPYEDEGTVRSWTLEGEAVDVCGTLVEDAHPVSLRW
ncbi:MAG: hypothetical protein H6735_01145 [Alphaproteobacteria bacterium]|nr:hypothetical protein [Alphaproteobacteria bacterium]